MAIGPSQIAYFVGRYPKISHTFVTREVHALRAQGVEVDTFAIWPTPQDELLTSLDRAEAERTFTFLPLRIDAFLRAQAAALAASPSGYLQLLRDAFRIARPGARGKFLALTWVAESTLLWSELRARGIRHVHAHLPGTAPAVAMLSTRFANRNGDAHSWSLTVHGPSEFYDVHNQALSSKLADAAFAVAISDFGRSQLMGLVDETHWDKLHVVHCGVDPSAYQPSGEDGPASEAAVRLITVGRLAPVKGHALLLEAIRELRTVGTDVRLTVVGDGPKRDTLARLAERLEVADAVEFTGSVGQDEISSYYASADIYVHASFAEGIPVVLMEAMAHGMPVVAAGVMGVRELVHDGETGVVVRPARVDDLVAAIRRLAANPDDRRRMGEAGRRVVEDEFDVRASAARLRELFARYAA